MRNDESKMPRAVKNEEKKSRTLHFFKKQLFPFKNSETKCYKKDNLSQLYHLTFHNTINLTFFSEIMHSLIG